MTKSKSRTTKSGAKSPAAVTATIQDTLIGFVLPTNPLCERGIAAVTLQNAHEVIELIDALDLQAFEMSPPRRSAVANMRQMALDALEYATELCNREDNLRGAFDRGEVANG